MESITIEDEAAIRIGAFTGVLLLMVLWELLAPRRLLSLPRSRRWATNLLLVAGNTLILRLLFPVAAVGAALLAQERQWGLFNQTGISAVPALVLTVLLLDFAIYWQHRLFHAIPVLWRLHRVHHADVDFDVTTGLRFHPLEIVLSMLIKISVVLLLGAPAAAVMLFEVILNATSMFNHGNVRLPLGLDRVLRWFLVTPDMHRVHHSVIPRETNSNFGFSVPWWDRLLGTYRAQPEAGHDAMQIGNEDYRQPGQVASIPGVLTMPFSPPAKGSAKP